MTISNEEITKMNEEKRRDLVEEAYQRNVMSDIANIKRRILMRVTPKNREHKAVAPLRMSCDDMLIYARSINEYIN